MLHDMLHIDQSFKSDILFLTLMSSSAYNVAIVVAMEQFEYFLLLPLVCRSKAMYMPCECLNIK